MYDSGEYATPQVQVDTSVMQIEYDSGGEEYETDSGDEAGHPMTIPPDDDDEVLPDFESARLPTFESGDEWDEILHVSGGSLRSGGGIGNAFAG